MKDNDDGRLYTHTSLVRESKRSVPLVIVLAILFIGSLVVGKVGNVMYTVKSYGVGNPYECAYCLDLGIACNKHRGFDSKQALEEKIEKYTYKFIPGKSEEEQRQLMYGADYNTNCDFCKENEEECYNCSTDRRIINDKLETISSDEVFKTKLNDKDWALGYANSSDGRAMLLREIKDSFKDNIKED